MMNERNTRRVPPPGPPTIDHQPSGAPAHDEPNTVGSLLRLLIGGATEGSSELARRLEVWQAEAERTRGEPAYAPDETDLDRLRYVLIGLMVETPDALGRGASAAQHVAGRSAEIASRALGPIAGSRLMRPVRKRYDAVAERQAARVERWIAQGRSEEHAGRALFRTATDEEIDELIRYLGDKPEVRDLVQQQSLGMADEVVGELRGQSAAADRLVERVVSVALGRKPPTDESGAAQLTDDDTPQGR